MLMTYEDKIMDYAKVNENDV